MCCSLRVGYRNTLDDSKDHCLNLFKARHVRHTCICLFQLHLYRITRDGTVFKASLRLQGTANVITCFLCTTQTGIYMSFWQHYFPPVKTNIHSFQLRPYAGNVKLKLALWNTQPSLRVLWVVSCCLGWVLKDCLWFWRWSYRACNSVYVALWTDWWNIWSRNGLACSLFRSHWYIVTMNSLRYAIINQYWMVEKDDHYHGSSTWNAVSLHPNPKTYVLHAKRIFLKWFLNFYSQLYLLEIKKLANRLLRL